MKNKIAIILPDLRGGGVERMRINLSKHFLQRGYDVEFVLLQKKGELLSFVPDEIRIVDLNVTKLWKGLYPLIRYFKKTKPDAVLAAMWPLTVITAWAKMLSGIKSTLVVSEHNQQSSTPVYQNGLNKWLMPLSMKLSYPLADKVVGVSNGVVDDLRNLSGLKGKYFKTVYNPAAPSKEFIDSTKSDEQFWNSDSSKKLIAIGSLKEQKDYPTLLKAFKKVAENTVAELLILGDGSERGKIESLIKEYQLKDLVHLPGFVERPIAYLKTADLFVLSSAWEGFGNVIVEAMACGVPVVSTDCKSGPAEILENGKYGTLVPVGEVDALANAIFEDLNKDHDPEPLKKRAQDFSVDKIADEYLKLLFPKKSK